MASQCSEYISLGIRAFDKLLPKGLPRKSLAVLAGEGGTGKSLIVLYSTWSGLQRGDRGAYISLDDDAETIYTAMKSKIGEKVDEYIKSHRLVLVDGYAARYGAALRGSWERMTKIDPSSLLQGIRSVVERYGLRECGMVVIDSLNPLFLQYEPTVVYDFINAMRATIAKQYNVFVLATLHTPTSLYAEIASMLEYMVDAFIVTRYHPEAFEAGLPVKQIMVKKAKGVPVAYGWLSFMITDEGIVEAKIKYEEQK